MDSGGLIPKYVSKGNQNNFKNSLRAYEHVPYTKRPSEAMKQKFFLTNARG